jgi:hypothetical protein
MFVMYKIFTSGDVITFEIIFPKIPKERPEMFQGRRIILSLDGDAVPSCISVVR